MRKSPTSASYTPIQAVVRGVKTKMSPPTDNDRYLSATPSPSAPTGSGHTGAEPRHSDVHTEKGPAGLAVATGSFASASGGTGVYTGTYRLERFVSQFGQLAAAGVFAGRHSAFGLG